MPLNRSIAIVDYGMGNVTSVQNALRQLGYDAPITRDLHELAAAAAYILPGVGAFAVAMENLKKLGLVDVLNEQVMKRKKPMLGICLGMQLLADSSTEGGEHRGLGWVPGRVEELDGKRISLPVPHVGWNNCVGLAATPELFQRIPEGSHFYFDHSYHFLGDAQMILATADYGGPVVAAIRHNNVFGVQFHPEKSQSSGLKLLRNYLNFVKETAC